MRRRRPCAAGLALLAFVIVAPRGGLCQSGAFSGSAHGNRSLLPMGCKTCHVGHGIPQSRMMDNTVPAVCVKCHGDATGRAAARSEGILINSDHLKNVEAEFLKTSRHPVNTTGAGVSTISCTDCHPPHWILTAANGGVQGGSGTDVKRLVNSRGQSQPEYELCYKCHGSTPPIGTAAVNIKRLFLTSNPSFHPVQTTGRNSDVPSLISPLTEQSIISCTDCHGSDQASGPRGPHGSIYSPILKAHYETDSGKPESSYQYELCYRCHSQSSILGDQSFSKHRRHIEGTNASCFACHNAHGSTEYTHLIDFDENVVFANRMGQLWFRDNGYRSGSCSLLCHGKNHKNKRY